MKRKKEYNCDNHLHDVISDDVIFGLYIHTHLALIEDKSNALHLKISQILSQIRAENSSLEISIGNPLVIHGRADKYKNILQLHYHVVSHMSLLKTLNHLSSNSFMEFLKDPSLVLYSSSYTPLLSVLSNIIHQQTITSMLMILNFSYHSQLWISLITSLTYNTL